ncbi:factor H binding protein domain-containing protein [Haemophilus parahaemolyticus]
MKLKNVTLAAALLAVLTGCGSSGGSNNSAQNAEINNNQATQAQIEQQKAEVEKLKQQLYQAQNTQKQAEDKLKVTENSSKADVATAQKNLADAQAKLANIQQNLAQAEKNLAENKTNQASLQKQFSQAQQAVEQAKLAKENSEKVLNQQLKSKENDVAQAKKSLEDAKAQLSTAQENLNKLQNRLDNLPTNQKEFDKQFTQAQKALEDAKQAKLDAETNLNKQIADRNADLAKVQENLTASNNKLVQVEKELKAAQASIQQSNADKSLIEIQLNQAKKDLEVAQKSKEEAEKTLKAQLVEKELNDKLTKENKLMSRAEVLDFALHNGLYLEDSEEFADDFQNKPKSYVIDQLIDTHKRITIKRLARRYGLPEAEVRIFAKENQNKTLEESTKILESKREEIAQKREALNKEIFELAKSKGLEEWEARNFAYGRHHSGKEEALKELNKYVTEKAERETKINELINLAKEKGLEDWEASNFAYSNVNNEHTKMLENLNQLAAEKEKQKAEQEKYRLQAEKEQKIRDLAEQYRTNYFGNASFDVHSFTEKYKDKTLEEAKAELDQFKTNREKVAELAKVLTELKVSDYTIEQFINDNTFLSLENAQANLDKKVTETINILKNIIYNNPSYGGTPLDKPLGFLAKEDLVTKKDSIIENDRETDRFITTTTYSDIYNQKYSVVTGNYHKQDREYQTFEYYYEDGDDRNSSPSHFRYVNGTQTTENYNVNDARGFKAPVDKFPTEGKAIYNGVAFDAKKQGQLKYTVNFTERKGSGAITGLDHIGDITLHEADLYKSASAGNMKIKGTAVANDWQNEGGVTGNYNVDFFGPNAEEIAGKMTLSQGQYKFVNNRGPFAPDKHINESVITTGQPINGNSYSTPTNSFDIGFGGTRGEIQK